MLLTVNYDLFHKEQIMIAPQGTKLKTKVNNIRYRNVKFRETVKRVRAINVQKNSESPLYSPVTQNRNGQTFFDINDSLFRIKL